jgi:hypothetical protein
VLANANSSPSVNIASKQEYLSERGDIFVYNKSMENANDNNQGYASILDDSNDAAPAGPAPAPTPTPDSAPASEPAPIAEMQPTPAPAPAPEPQPTQYQTLTQTSVAPVSTATAPEAPKKKSKAPIIIVVVLLVVLLTGGGIAAALILPGMQKKNQFMDTASSLIEKVKAQDDDKLIYFLRDLKKIQDGLDTSPYGLEYRANSFATRIAGNVTLCLTDGENRITNYSGELTIEEEGDCTYNLTDNDAVEYLINYYKKNKGLNISKSDVKKVADEFIINTDKGVIYSSVSLSKNTIAIEDDIDTLDEDLEDIVDLADIIKNRTFKMLGISKFDNKSHVYDVTVYEDDGVIMVKTDYKISDATKYLEGLQSYLTNKKLQNAKIGVARILSFGDISNLRIENDYILGLYYQEGKTTIKTLAQKETADKEIDEIEEE